MQEATLRAWCQKCSLGRKPRLSKVSPIGPVNSVVEVLTSLNTAEALWDELKASNSALAETFATLTRLSVQDGEAYAKEVTALSKTSGDEVSIGAHVSNLTLTKRAQWSNTSYPFAVARSQILVRVSIAVLRPRSDSDISLDHAIVHAQDGRRVGSPHRTAFSIETPRRLFCPPRSHRRWSSRW